MSILTYYDKITAFQDQNNSRLNTWLNHLVVIFAFLLPISNSGRASTAFIIYLLFLVRGKYAYYLRSAIKDRLVQAFLLYFLVHAVWLIGTENFVEATKVMGQAKYLLYPLLLATIVDKKFIPRIFAAFFLGMVFSEMWSYGIFLEFLPPHIHDANQGTPADPTPVFHHTHYGFMLAVTLTFVLQRFFYEKYTPLLRFVVILFLCTATINIFITAGRTGYVLYIILLLTMFMLVFRARLVAAGSVALLVICVSLGLAYGFSDTFQKRLTQTVDSIEAMTVQGDFESSLGARAAVIGSSKDVVLDNWLFGVGTGDHLDTVRKHIDQAYPQYSHMANSFQHLHNEYFSAITQFGLLGLMAFLYLLFQLVVYPQEDQALKNAQIILAVATALFGIIDIVVLGLGALLMLVTISGLSLNHYTVSNARLPQMSRKLIAMYAVSITGFELVSWVT